MGNLGLNNNVAIHFEIFLAIGCACLITLNCMLIVIGVFFTMCTLKIVCYFLTKHHGNVGVFLCETQLEVVIGEQCCKRSPMPNT
jgi:hypothetical protein